MVKKLIELLILLKATVLDHPLEKFKPMSANADLNIRSYFLACILLQHAHSDEFCLSVRQTRAP